MGKTTWYNRQASVRMVVCYRFGLTPSADFPVSAAMTCGLVAVAIGHGADKLGTFVDGACSGADLASDPKEPTKYISLACGWASDLLGVLAKPAGELGSLGCTLAPPAGYSLGAKLESKHEFDVAMDVMQHQKCIKYSPTHFGSPWLAVKCGPNDAGFFAQSATPHPAESPHIVFDGSPGVAAPPESLGPYHMTPFAFDSQELGEVEGVDGPSGRVAFSVPLNHLYANEQPAWQTWSNEYFGDVYANELQSSVTLTLPPGTHAFYFYAEPDHFATFNITGTAQDGITSGAVPIYGEYGAAYFGFYAIGEDLSTVTVECGEDQYAIGELGILADFGMSL